MRRVVLISVALAVFALSAAAAAAGAQAPSWNSGYGWWPGGFGYAPLTVQAHNYPCSVTAYGATFNYTATSWNQNYGGGTSCASGVGQKTLTISGQVLGPDRHRWFTITGSTFTTGPAKGNPLRRIRNRAAFLGHTYRILVFAKLIVPNGRAGCSLNDTCSQTITVTAISKLLAP